MNEPHVPQQHEATDPTTPLWYGSAAPTATVPAPPSATWPTTPVATVASPAPRRGRARVGELALVAILAAGLASGGTYAVTQNGASSTPAASSVTKTSTVAVGATAAPVIAGTSSAPDWAAMAKAVGPSVVSITVQAGQSGGEGSGVVIDTAGHILTNNHVVAAGGSRETITVTLADGRTYDATIAGTDPATDLAVLTLKDPPTDLAPIAFADSDALVVGQPVMAVGNPLGLAGTVTTGIVSALNRPVTTGGETDQFGTVISEPVVTDAIQTSAAINPGNSGGALVDAGGKLIGINSSIASLGSSQSQSGNIGIGFAIPSNTAKSVAEQLISDGKVSHAYLGVSTQDTVATEGADRRNAALVTKVVSGSAADTAGLRANDIVVAINGKRVDSSLSLVASVRELTSGETATITVLRDGARVDLTATLGTRS